MLSEKKYNNYKSLEDQMRVAGKFFGEFFRKTLTKPMGNNKDFTLLELKGMSAFIDRNGEYTMSELSRNAHLPLSNVSMVIASLEKKGLALRGRDTKDRRVVKVQLTEEGKKMMANFIRNREQDLEKILGALSEKDRKDLFGSLEKAASILKKIKL